MHLKLTSAPKEPVGGSAPKLTGVSVRVYLAAFQHQPLALSCPAQGAPVPAFRFVNLTMTTELKTKEREECLHFDNFFVIKRTKNSAFWFGSKDEDCIFFHYFLASSRLNYLALLYI